MATKPTPSPATLTIPQIQARLGMTEYQVYDRIRNGVIPAHHAGPKGRRVVVLAAEFEEWVAHGQPPPPLPPVNQLHVELGCDLFVEIEGYPGVHKVHVRGVVLPSEARIQRERGRESTR